MLKIQGGRAKGHSIQTPKGLEVRPILARVKKSLFDILRPRLANSQFLDLFSGSGAVGLEAISQGAAWVTFVEQEYRFASIIEGNLRHLKFEGNGTVVRQNVLGGLNGVSAPCDIIFMGPPYKDQQKNPLTLVTPTLKEIHKAGLLAPNGLIVAQHQKKETVEMPSADWILFRQEKYGDTLLSFVRPA